MGERHTKGVLPVAGAVAASVGFVLGFVIGRDVGRIAHYDVIALAEDFPQSDGIFDSENRVHVEQVSLVRDRGPLVVERGLASPQQAVARGEVEFPRIALLVQFLDATGLHRSQEEAETSDRNGERVDVHAEDAIERILGRDDGVVDVLLRLHPLVEQAVECPEQEVPGTTGGVDQAQVLQPELVEGVGERSVEDELLDELRGLFQGVFLLGVFGQVLVQITQKTGLGSQILIDINQGLSRASGRAERAFQSPRLGVDLSKILQKSPRHIPAGINCPQWGFPFGEQLGRRRDLADLGEDVFQVFPVGLVRMLPEEEFVGSFGQFAPVALPCQPALVDEVVVFHEPDEDAGQHPRHGDLIEIVFPPFLVALGDAASVLDLLVGRP